MIHTDHTTEADCEACLAPKTIAAHTPAQPLLSSQHVALAHFLFIISTDDGRITMKLPEVAVQQRLTQDRLAALVGDLCELGWLTDRAAKGEPAQLEWMPVMLWKRPPGGVRSEVEAQRLKAQSTEQLTLRPPLDPESAQARREQAKAEREKRAATYHAKVDAILAKLPEVATKEEVARLTNPSQLGIGMDAGARERLMDAAFARMSELDSQWQAKLSGKATTPATATTPEPELVKTIEFVTEVKAGPEPEPEPLATASGRLTKKEERELVGRYRESIVRWLNAQGFEVGTKVPQAQLFEEVPELQSVNPAGRGVERDAATKAVKSILGWKYHRQTTVNGVRTSSVLVRMQQ